MTESKSLMTIEEFIKTAKIQTSDAAVEETISNLEQPAGRSPSEKAVRLSEWYKQLAGTDQQMLKDILREAAEAAIFGFFCILDGVRVIENTPEKGELNLHFVKGAERVLLNDPNEEELHNLFNSACAETAAGPGTKTKVAAYQTGQSSSLKSEIQIGDRLDIHHVPVKHVASKTIAGYEAAKAPAILLPGNEHRNIPVS